VEYRLGTDAILQPTIRRRIGRQPCVSGARRILVDVMVAQLSRVQDRAVVLQRSTRQELEEEISSCLLIHLGESSLSLVRRVPREEDANNWSGCTAHALTSYHI